MLAVSANCHNHTVPVNQNKVRGSLKNCIDHWTRFLSDLEYSYSNHDIWPGDVATVALCHLSLPQVGQH